MPAKCSVIVPGRLPGGELSLEQAPFFPSPLRRGASCEAARGEVECETLMLVTLTLPIAKAMGPFPLPLGEGEVGGLTFRLALLWQIVDFEDSLEGSLVIHRGPALWEGWSWLRSGQRISSAGWRRF